MKLENAKNDTTSVAIENNFTKAKAYEKTANHTSAHQERKRMLTNTCSMTKTYTLTLRNLHVQTNVNFALLLKHVGTHGKKETHGH